MLGNSGLTREELDQWEKRGLVDSNFLNLRYTEKVKEILDRDSPKAARLFLKRLRLALRFEDAMAPFWQMVVVIKKYELEGDFEDWIAKRIDKDEATEKIRLNLPGLIEFSNLPQLTELHNYLYYYRGLERIKKLAWHDNPGFYQFVDELEESLSKFDIAVKQLLFYWSAYVWSKFAFFITDQSPAFFDRGSSEKNHAFGLALYRSVSEEEQERIMEAIKLWVENKETQKSPVSFLFHGLLGLQALEDIGKIASQDVWPTKEMLDKLPPNKIGLPEDVQELSKLLGFVEQIDGVCQNCEYDPNEAPLEAFPDEIARAFIELKEGMLMIKDRIDTELLTEEDYEELNRNLEWMKTMVYYLIRASHTCCEKQGKTDPELEDQLLKKINRED